MDVAHASLTLDAWTWLIEEILVSIHGRVSRSSSKIMTYKSSSISPSQPRPFENCKIYKLLFKDYKSKKMKMNQIDGNMSRARQIFMKAVLQPPFLEHETSITISLDLEIKMQQQAQNFLMGNNDGHTKQ